MSKVGQQVITEDYALYNGDCIETMQSLPDESIGFVCFSPPFSSLYSYSNDHRDLSNCKTKEEFFTHFGYVVEQLTRLVMPGRIVAVHCMDLPMFKNQGDEIGIWDFPSGLREVFDSFGWIFHARIMVWKDPLIAATRTKSIGLAHKQIVKDSSICRTGIADQILVFRKSGENPKPIKHPRGLSEYYGERSIPKNLDHYIAMQQELQGDGIEPNPYDGRKDKRSHWIWQQYASPVYFDVRETRVLPYRGGRDPDDQRHICPLQLDVVERCMELWSTEGDTFLTPFGGIGTEAFVAVKNGRKAILAELKTSYFRQAVKNLQSAKKQRSEGFGGI